MLGRYGTERVGGGEAFRVRGVDIVAERRESWRQGVGGIALRRDSARPNGDEALRSCEAGGQVILLLNRRGYSRYVCCRQGCGWMLQCDHCDAAMVVHRVPPAAALVRCHHFLAEQVIPPLPRRGARGVTNMGFGTQRVEEELTVVLGPIRAPAPGRSGGPDRVGTATP